MGVELTNEQIYATYKMESWWKSKDKQIFEISGAGGTGKTTLVTYLIDRIGLKYKNVLFMTYMGKAATQLARHGLPAKTIHSSIYDYEEKVIRDENGHLSLDEKGKIQRKKEFVLKDHLDKKIKLIVIDEGSMVSKKIANDILSFGIPVIVLGDLNQLPPVFGDPFFLTNPDIILTKIMRQAEGNPIIYLCQRILNGFPLHYGVYGNSFVIPKKDIDEYKFTKADIVLTGTNSLRYNINNFYREKLKKIKQLDYPHVNEKVICRRNNWDQCIDGGFYLTNGMTGIIENIYKESFKGSSMKFDFRPDFGTKTFKNIRFDYKHMYRNPNSKEPEKDLWFLDKFEFAYAITVHSSQGSQWPNVLYLHEDFMHSNEDRKKLMYTAISRASEQVGIVI